jgi:hypothetical protein
MLYLQYKTHFTTYSGILNCCLQLQETLPKLKTFSSVTTTPLSKIDVFLMNVKCFSCLFYTFSSLSDNNNKMHNCLKFMRYDLL